MDSPWQKESEIGLIGNDWELVRLHEVAESPQYGFTASAAIAGNTQFLRITDIEGRKVNWRSVPYCDCPADDLTKYRLASGDIVFARIGATTGKTAFLVDPPNAVFASYLIRVRAKPGLDPEFLSHFLQSQAYWIQIDGSKHTNLKKGVNGSLLKALLVPKPPLAEQRKIARLLSAVQRAIEQQEQLIALTAELKNALMHKLFSEGIRGEPLKETEIGPVPESWYVTQLGRCCDIIGSSMSYGDFDRATEHTGADAVQCMAVKVSDMNLSGNEEAFKTANASKPLSLDIAKTKLVPPGAVVFPKRGAAIATNKKRQTTTWTALDPNLIAIHAKAEIDPRFLFYWSQIFDLKKITDPGPTPQLNKKDLMPVNIAVPPTLEEQRIISNALDDVNAKLTLHRRVESMMSSLFRTLLHQLMTAQVRVHDLNLSALDELAPEMAEVK